MTKTQYNIYKKIKNSDYSGLLIKTNVEFTKDDYEVHMGYGCYCFGMSFIIKNGTYYQAVFSNIIDWDDKGGF